MRRALLVLVALTAVAVAAFSAFRYFQPPQHAATGQLIAVQHVGPHKLFAWQIDDLDGGGDGGLLCAVIRAKHDVRAEGESLVTSGRPLSPDAANEEIVLGGFGIADANEVGVLVQLFDVRNLAATSDRAASPLRLLVQISWGFYDSGEKTIIQGDTIVGDVWIGSPEWQDGEMHLYNLYTQSADRKSTYSVFLRRSDSLERSVSP